MRPHLDHTAARLLGHSVWRRLRVSFQEEALLSGPACLPNAVEPSPASLRRALLFPRLCSVQLKEKEAKASTGGVVRVNRGKEGDGQEKRRKQFPDLSELGWPLESQLLFPAKVIRARKQTKAWGNYLKKRQGKGWQQG